MGTNYEKVTKNKEKKMDVKKMSLIAGIAAVVLIVVLVASIVLSNATGLNQIKKDIDIELGTVTELVFNAKDYFKVDDEVAEKIEFDVSEVDLKKTGEYKAYAKYGGREYVIKVVVSDTTAPKAEMEQRYIFTNDVAKFTDLTPMIKEVNDASDYTLKLIRFEKKETLKVLNDLELNNLTAGSDSFVTEEEALKVGTEDMPTEAGIYRSVLKIEDAEGNASYEEVFVILDTTGALINDVPDQVVEVAKENLSAAPTLDETLYKGVDNVDGEITFSELTTELTVRDEAKHEWIVKVSYTDRAGNESSGEFLITVVEKKASSNNNGGKNEGSGNKNQGSGDKTNVQNENPGTKYDPRDENKDGYVSTDEEMRYITPEKQACIDAGYGVVVEMDGGKWYAVLMKNSEHTINGKNGWEILTEYLSARDLEAGSGGGCWINSEKGWYWWTAEDIQELIGPDDDEYWEL